VPEVAGARPAQRSSGSICFFSAGKDVAPCPVRRGGVLNGPQLGFERVARFRAAFFDDLRIEKIALLLETLDVILNFRGPRRRPRRVWRDLLPLRTPSEPHGFPLSTPRDPDALGHQAAAP
jgi:hypothetical protein